MFLEALRIEWRAAGDRFGRLALLSFSVAAAFVLLAVGNVSEATFLGVAADRAGVELIVKTLPAIFAALAGETMMMAKITAEYLGLHRSLLHHLHPNLLWGNLDFAIAPALRPSMAGDW